MNTLAKPRTQVRLKAEVRSALRDILREEPQLLQEALEDLALARAIEEGMKSGPASRDEVYAKLRAAGR
jgi:hypothetical protein